MSDPLKKTKHFGLTDKATVRKISLVNQGLEAGNEAMLMPRGVKVTRIKKGFGCVYAFDHAGRRMEMLAGESIRFGPFYEVKF